MARETAERKSRTLYDIINDAGRRNSASDFCLTMQGKDPALFKKAQALVAYLGMGGVWAGYWLALEACLAELSEAKRAASAEVKYEAAARG